MENTRIEQLEALETLIEFNSRLLRNLPTIISELSGNRQEDTDNYLKTIIDAINWELNSALSAQSDPETATALRDLVPCFEQLDKAAREVTK